MNIISSYYPYVYDAEINYEKKNYKKAYYLYNKAFSNFKPKNTITHYEIDKMARICAILNKYNESYNYIKLQIFEQGFTISKYKNDSLFNNFFVSDYGKLLLRESIDLRNNYLKNIDTLLTNKLIKMSLEDQMFRTEKTQQLLKKQDSIDSFNKIFVKEILDNYGYPKEHLARFVSPKRIHFDVILLHTDSLFRFNYLIPKLYDEILKGNCDPQIYAQLHDQHLIYKKQKQIYGTYLNRDRTISNHISLDSIDLNRKKIGLISLKQKNELHNLKIINYPNTYGKLFKN